MPYERPMRRALACLVPIALVLTGGPGRAADPLPDPLKLYGDEMLFSVWRSGSEIGQHRVTFTREGDTLAVRSLFDVVVRLLGIPVFRYKYQSDELWHGSSLAQLTSTIDDNGTPHSVTATRQDGKLSVTGPDAHETVTGPILPSTHWNAQTIDATRIINTLDGKIDSVKLVPSGQESVPAGSVPRQATHYVYSGDLKAESWYDSEGHWVKLRFPGTDGTPIEYVCVRCFAP
jgi:hypothetical protein